MRIFYPFLNLLFHFFHLSVIFFTAFGWIHPQLRLLHLIWILLTLGSWFVLGRWFGVGYCPVTDVHWRIKDRWGEGRPAGTYFDLMTIKLFGAKSIWVDRVVVGGTLLLFIVAVLLNVLPLLSI